MHYSNAQQQQYFPPPPSNYEFCCTCNAWFPPPLPTVANHQHHNNAYPTTNDYYVCDCTTCRNLGNSVDICCQCCACGGTGTEEYGGTQQFQVSSVTLTGESDDTLEVCLQDDIALAHSVAEGADEGTCSECGCDGPRFPGWAGPRFVPAGHPHYPSLVRRNVQLMKARQQHVCNKGVPVA